MATTWPCELRRHEAPDTAAGRGPSLAEWHPSSSAGCMTFCRHSSSTRARTHTQTCLSVQLQKGFVRHACGDQRASLANCALCTGDNFRVCKKFFTLAGRAQRHPIHRHAKHGKGCEVAVFVRCVVPRVVSCESRTSIVNDQVLAALTSDDPSPDWRGNACSLCPDAPLASEGC